MIKDLTIKNSELLKIENLSYDIKNEESIINSDICQSFDTFLVLISRLNNSNENLEIIDDLKNQLGQLFDEKLFLAITQLRKFTEKKFISDFNLIEIIMQGIIAENKNLESNMFRNSFLNAS